MNKSELIVALSEEVNLSIRESSQIVDTILDSLSEALVRGDGIELRGFGTFEIRQYGSYIGRNPKNSELVKVNPKKLPFFKVGRQLKRDVNANK